MLTIEEMGYNIQLAKQATTSMAPIIMSNGMTSRLPDGSTMESSHIATLQLPGLIKQEKQIHIPPKIKTTPIISLGVLCDDGYTIKLDKQYMSVYNNGL